MITGSDIWFYDFNGKKIFFVDRLKELGNVVIFKPNYVNFMRYSKTKIEKPLTKFMQPKVVA